MNIDKKTYAENQDELEILSLELLEIKGVLRELSQQILRIERRVRAVLPAPEKSQKSNQHQRLDESAAHRTITRLTECAKSGKQIENELRNMTVKGQLAIMARELGMTNTKLPPKDDLIRRISTRIRQSASVVSGIQGGVREENESNEYVE
ncbi:MAG: hypothetical protein OXC05_03760 [Halieaceae bacterium]|nr:hypothetical protein [Halieaceae bacterium]